MSMPMRRVSAPVVRSTKAVSSSAAPAAVSTLPATSFDAPARVAELGLHLLEGAERRLADLEVAHVEIAEAEVENLVKVLVFADELGVSGGAEVGKDAVLAEHQEQGLVGARAVGAAGEAVERLGLRRLRAVRAWQRRDGVDDEAARDRDGGADGGLAEQA